MDVNSRLTKLEEVLLQADIGAATTRTIIDDLRTYARQEALTVDDILPVLRSRLIESLTPVERFDEVNIQFVLNSFVFSLEVE